MHNNDDEDNKIYLLELEVVNPKKTRTKRKRKYPVFINVVGFESFAVENTRRSSRLPYLKGSFGTT